MIRVSFRGELGWEIHAANADMPAIYEAVLDAGAKPFGMYALNSLRIEKGYRAWKGDLSTDYSMLEGGLDRFVKLRQAAGFPRQGGDAGEKQQGVKKRFVTLIVDAGRDAPYMATIWQRREVVGETTSAPGVTVSNASVALGMMRTDLAARAPRSRLKSMAQRCKAVVQPDGPTVGSRE